MQSRIKRNQTTELIGQLTAMLPAISDIGISYLVGQAIQLQQSSPRQTSACEVVSLKSWRRSK